MVQTTLQVRPVPGPTGGSPLISGYSEIYPDFMGNYQRLLAKYGRMVHVSYLGKSIYLTDDPTARESRSAKGSFSRRGKSLRTRDLVYVSNAERVTPDWEEHPLFALKMTIQTGFSRRTRATRPGPPAAMRDYIRTMDHTANQLVKLVQRTSLKREELQRISMAAERSAQTIGEIAIGIDFKMLDGQVAEIFQVISRDLTDAFPGREASTGRSRTPNGGSRKRKMRIGLTRHCRIALVDG
ncbi:hypothetical protein B0H13DRAFT_2329969 [Mycena leptocephala]|nr:hypothetical protein B0H13DRAFT_2329969 [Mycena leptocephala]